ncbi:hypothetical protein REPUB_Repub01dG0176600 [Reevesia pubescens]
MKMLSKLLTKSDVEKSLLIPTCSLDVFPFEECHSFYMNVVYQTGNAWTFRCFIQQMSDDHDQSIAAGSSVVSIGWQKFAWKNDVRVGDVVVHKDDKNFHRFFFIRMINILQGLRCSSELK